MSFGVMEILLVLAILIFFFGAKRIPVIAKGLGEGIRNFRSSVREAEREGEDRQLTDGEED
jgi:sec-independent protein translocase protein TatA